MVRMISTLSLLAVLALFAFYLRAPRAEQVDHHGNMVDVACPTSECLLCHDGSIAKSVSNCVGVRCNLSINSHPVERTYPAKDSFVNYGDVLRSGINLNDGKVNCISCHDLRNQEQRHLVVNGNLCFKCHIK
jgi:hypothetical protein